MAEGDPFTQDEVLQLVNATGRTLTEVTNLALDLRKAGIELQFPEPRYFVDRDGVGESYRVRATDTRVVVAGFWLQPGAGEDMARRWAESYCRELNVQVAP